MRTLKLAPILGFALVVAGSACTSATKRLEQGQQLEQQGRRTDAARRYIDALRKDPSLTEARQRLFETGNGGLDARLTQECKCERRRAKRENRSAFNL